MIEATTDSRDLSGVRAYQGDPRSGYAVMVGGDQCDEPEGPAHCARCGGHFAVGECFEFNLSPGGGMVGT